MDGSEKVLCNKFFQKWKFDFQSYNILIRLIGAKILVILSPSFVVLLNVQFAIVCWNRCNTKDPTLMAYESATKQFHSLMCDD